MELYKRLQNRCYNLGKDFGCLIANGPDAQRFLNGQLTNDVTLLEVGQFQLQSRLDRAGKLQSFFYLARGKEDYYLLIPKDLKVTLKEDLERFIIMDDLELQDKELDTWLHWTFYNVDSKENTFKGMIAGAPCLLSFEKPSEVDLLELKQESFENFMVIQGEPVLNKTAKINQLVTDTIVNLNGVSLSKGCFLGQETVSKIETRRGGAYFPVILVGNHLPNVSSGIVKVDGRKAGEILWNGLIDEERIIVASLLRDYRVEGRLFKFSLEEDDFNGTVKYIPYYATQSKSELAESLYEHAVKVFQETDEQTAIKEFEEILKIDPLNEDSFEAIGVIFGRMEKFKEGIDFMNRVLDANPDSVMAHTNKSLFYMRLGEIEKAEEEKAQATVKSFGQFGKEAQEKKKLEELKKQEEAEINRRFGMFQQVLEIDPEDALANYGLADIYFQRGEPLKSIPLLEKVLESDPKYSVGYLLLGKCLIETKNTQRAKEVFEKGIEVASKLGDLMPANEMQAKLVSLN